MADEVEKVSVSMEPWRWDQVSAIIEKAVTSYTFSSIPSLNDLASELQESYEVITRRLIETRP